MKRSEVFPSKFYSKHDVTVPATVTIAYMRMDKMKERGRTVEKPVLHFEGTPKMLVLNKSTWDFLAKECGDDSDDWRGKTVQLYEDKTVTFGLDVVGGLRIRTPGAVKKRTSPTAAPPAEAQDDEAEAEEEAEPEVEEEPPVEIWSWERAQEAAEAAEVDFEDVKDALREKGVEKYNAVRHSALVQTIIRTLALDEIPF